MKRPVYWDMFAKQNEVLCHKGYDFDTFLIKEVQEREDILYNLQEEYGGTDKPVNHIKPIVSVCIPTYQHVQYIGKCLDGALMQETTFPIEIIIGDDGSVDGTVDVCKDYAERFPDKIRFFNRERVLTRVFDSEAHIERFCNWWWTLRDARGKYVAICEGDDYWIDPLKLQKQVDFLENHPDYGLVYGGAKVFYQSRNEYGKNLIGSSCLDVDDLLIANRVVTLTTCFHRTLYLHYVNEIMPLLDRSKMGDYPLWLYIAFHSKLHFFSEPLGVYRVLDESVSHNRNAREEAEFVLSSYSIKKMFVEKYGKKYLLKRIRRFVVETIEKKYLSHDEKCDISLLRANELSIFVSLRSVVLYVLSCFNWSRKLYLRKNVNS